MFAFTEYIRTKLHNKRAPIKMYYKSNKIKKTMYRLSSVFLTLNTKFTLMLFNYGRRCFVLQSISFPKSCSMPNLTFANGFAWAARRISIAHWLGALKWLSGGCFMHLLASCRFIVSRPLVAKSMKCLWRFNSSLLQFLCVNRNFRLDCSVLLFFFDVFVSVFVLFKKKIYLGALLTLFVRFQ